jgi:glycosyltransferase involved in cell wall biosynthesis
LKLTIGMPSYKNFEEVFFTVQSLKMHHDLKDTEIVVIDNFGDTHLEKFARGSGIRYEKFIDITGVSAAKNKVFEVAKGEYVLCMDSHILLAQDALKDLPEGDNFIQGPLVHGSCRTYTCEWLPVWRGNMWGIWGKNMLKKDIPKDPFEIWAMGAGFFLCRRDTWLGFNSRFKGFGGETGYIQEKYRKSGRKVICHPPLIWMHMFDRKIPYPLKMVDRVRNYILGFEEIGLDTNQIKDHFGQQLFDEANLLVQSGN